MGIARILREALGVGGQESITPAPTVSDIKENTAADVSMLQKHETLLQEKKEEIEKELSEVQKQMSSTDITPQPQPAAKEASVMDSNKEAKEEKENKEEVKEGDKKEASISPAGTESTKISEVEPVLVTKEETPAAKVAFSIRFVQGSTFDNSYFVAEDGKQFLAVKASRIIPRSVQNKIIHALATTKQAPEDIVSPTEIVDQLSSQGVDSLESFKTAMLELETNAKSENEKEGTTKTAGMMAWNESEVMKQKLPKPEEGPLKAEMEAEAEAGMKSHPAPAPKPSKVKQYYNRLPTSAGGDPTKALNPQSALLMEKIELLRRALEEQKAKADAAESKAKEAEDKASKMAKDKEDSDHSGLMESIVKDLVGKKLIDAKDEQGAISLLSKIERKSLSHVAALLKLMGKGGKEALPMPPAGPEDKKAPLFGDEKAPKASVQIPAAFVQENGPDIASAPSFMAKFWDAK